MPSSLDLPLNQAIAELMARQRLDPTSPFRIEDHSPSPRPQLASPSITRTPDVVRGAATILPATSRAATNRSDGAATNSDDGGGLPSWLRNAVLPAMLGYAGGASIRQGSAAPLVSGVTGYLGGRAERQQREAEALAKEEERRLAARKAKLEEQALRQSLQPEFRFSRGGFTGTFTPEAVPESVFGQPLKPEAREREEQARLEKGFSELELGFERLPVERFGRPFQSGSQFFQHSPDTGDISLAPGSPEPTIMVLGRRFPDTPKGQQAALEWVRQRGAAGRADGGGGGGGSAASAGRAGASAGAGRAGTDGSRPSPVQFKGVTGARNMAKIMVEQGGADANGIFDVLSQTPGIGDKITVPELREIANKAVESGAGAGTAAPAAPSLEETNRIRQSRGLAPLTPEEYEARLRGAPRP